MYFFGRKNELNELNNIFNQSTGALIKVDGRRRVGKTSLVQHFIQDKINKGYNVVSFSFIGNNTYSSLENIKYNLKILTTTLDKVVFNLNNVNQIFDNHLMILELKNYVLQEVKKIKNWIDFFFLLEHVVDSLYKHGKSKNIKIMIFFDEIAWYSNNNKFIAALSNTYNRNWYNLDSLMIFMATSVSSWFNLKFNKMDSFYARISVSITLKPFTIDEIYSYCKNQNPNINTLDVIKYYLIFGGVIKYYQYLQLNKNYEYNLNHIVNNKTMILESELQILFDNLFGVKKKINYYHDILEILCCSKSLNFQQIINKLMDKNKIEHTASLEAEVRFILQTLTDSHLLLKSQQKDRKQNSNYMICDQFIYFNYYWNKIANLSSLTIQDQFYSTWKGSAFEIMVVYNHHIITNQFNHQSYQLLLNWMSDKELNSNRKASKKQFNKNIINKGKAQIDILIKETFKHSEMFNIVECKCYESNSAGFIFDASAEDEIYTKYECLTLDLIKDRNGHSIKYSHDNKPNINIIYVVIDEYKNRFINSNNGNLFDNINQKIKFISVKEYLEA